MTQIFVFGSHENLRATKRNYELCQAVYQLLGKICEKNHLNQIYAFQYLEIFVRQAAYFDEALVLLTQLFRHNEILVEAVTRTASTINAPLMRSEGIKRNSLQNTTLADLSSVDARICVLELVERFKGTRNPLFLDLLSALSVCAT